MDTESNNILQQSLSLPESERADIAASLFLSLDPESDSDADKLWAVEIKNRLDSIDNGNAKIVPWSDVKSKMITFENPKRSPTPFQYDCPVE